MPLPKLTTIGDALYWSYAYLTLNIVVLEEGLTHPATKHYKIRSRLFAGLRNGTMNVRGFFADEKFKLEAPRVCWYCGGTERLSADHIVPLDRGGTDSGENLIWACRSCNS